MAVMTIRRLRRGSALALTGVLFGGVVPVHAHLEEGAGVLSALESAAPDTLDDLVVLTPAGDSAAAGEVAGATIDIPIDPSDAIDIGVEHGDMTVSIGLPFADSADRAEMLEEVS